MYVDIAVDMDDVELVVWLPVGHFVDLFVEFATVFDALMILARLLLAD